MKQTLRLIFALSVALAATMGLAQQSPAPQKQTPPPGEPPKAFTLPQKETFTLPNGLRVTMVPYGNIPKVAVAAEIRVGGLNEPADKTWICDLTGRLMKDGGTTSRTSEQVAEQGASMGGEIQINPGADQTQVYADVLSESGPQMVALMADVIQHPLHPDSELTRLKQDALRRLAIIKSQSQPLASEAFMKTLYPEHPYGHIYPSEEMLNKISIDDAQKFYKDNFGAARTHIYVVGKFDAAAMKKAITDSYSAWSKGPDPLIEIPKHITKREFVLIDRPNAAQSTVYVGLPTIDPSDPDFVRLLVTNTLLGGSFASRITSNIREQKGYTYSPFSLLSSRYRDAYWAEIADVTTAVTGPSIQEILKEVERIRKEPPGGDELQGIKDYMAGIFVLQNSSRQGIIGQLVFSDLHHLGDDYLQTYVQKVYAVTAEQVQQTSQKYLIPDKMTIVVVGDKSKIASQLAPYEGAGE